MRRPEGAKGWAGGREGNERAPFSKGWNSDDILWLRRPCHLTVSHERALTHTPRRLLCGPQVLRLQEAAAAR